MRPLITDLLEYTRTRLGAGMPIDRSACDLGSVCEASLNADAEVDANVGRFSDLGDPISSDAPAAIF